MKRLIGIFLAVVLAAAVTAAPVCGEMFKWTDDNGVVHWSNTVPEGHGERYQETDGAYGAASSDRPSASVSPNRNPVAAKGRSTAERDLRKWAADSYPGNYTFQKRIIASGMTAYDKLASIRLDRDNKETFKLIMDFYPNFQFMRDMYYQQMADYLEMELDQVD